MTARRLAPLPVGMSYDPGSALAAVRDALSGRGPAVIPVPDGPAGAAVLAMARPDVPLETDAGDAPVALVVPTSGSTGAPKGALLTAAALRASAAATLDRLGGAGQWLLTLPLTHIAGLQVLVRSVIGGIDPVHTPGEHFEPLTFAACTDRLVGERRYTALVPTQLRRLLDGPAAGRTALMGYDAVLVGGAALDERLRVAAVQAGVRIVRTYGMSETCGGCVYEGVPLNGVLVRAPADGPIRLGGEVVFSGYRLRPDLTTAALDVVNGVRWHRTADQGRLDSQGRLEVLGRIDDLIVTGGEKVAPTVVENALLAHPNVREAVVVGVPDDQWGERVVAVVTVGAGPPPTLAAVREFLAGKLPPHALPRQLVEVASIPVLPSGKPDRAAVRLAVPNTPT